MDPLSLTTTKGKGFFIVLEAIAVLAHAREALAAVKTVALNSWGNSH